MRASPVLVLVLAGALVSCSDPAPASSPSRPAPARASPAQPPVPSAAPEPAIPEAPPAEEPALPSEPVAEPSAAPLEPPPRSVGLPELTRGPVVRLPAVEITERTVEDRRVPTVAITDLQSRARLDELLERATRPPSRCRVLLATETLVSLSCVVTFYDMGPAQRDHANTHYRVGVGGDVQRIELESLLLEGTNDQDLANRILYRPAAHQQRFVLAQTALVSTSYASIEEGPAGERPARVGYRALAPYVRAGTVLGDLLEAQGIPLAQAGTPMPPLPAAAPAIWSNQVEPLLTTWWRLAPRERAQARLITPGGEHPAALVFVPGTDRAVLSGVGRVADGLFQEPHAPLVYARALERLELSERPGPRTMITGTVPVGGIVAMADGMVGDVDSRLGRGGWALVSTGRGDWGWTQSRGLASLAEGECVLEASPPSASVSGTVELTQNGTSAPVAFFVTESALTVHALDGCTVGGPLLSVEAERPIRDLLFTRTGRDSGDSLLVVVSGSRSDDLTVGVYAPGSAEPLLRREIGGDAVSVSVARGRAEYSPLRIGQGARASWLTWDGTTLVEAGTAR